MEVSLGARRGLRDNRVAVPLPKEYPSPAPPPSPVVIHHLAGWRRRVLRPPALLVRAWTSTLRFELSPAARHDLNCCTVPTVFVLWHNRLVVAAELFRRFRRTREVHALVSASRDGAWSEAFLQLAGLHAVRGSSSRGGREAARALVAVLQSGQDVGLTPDGPRGPAYGFKEGALIVARRAHAPMLLVGAAFDSACRLPSWDGLYLPQPFSRIRLECKLVPAAEVAERTAGELEQMLRTLSPDIPDPTPAI